MKIDNPKLASGRSPDWAFMERFAVPDYDTDADYLVRWRLIQTPWGGIYLHKFMLPDPRATLHDHPWPFVAFVLRGGYDEWRRDSHDPGGLGDYRVFVDGRREILPVLYAYPRWVGRGRRWNLMPLDSLHWISKLHRVPTWTLVFVGRRRRVWGYLDRDGTWTDFLTHPHNDAFKAAMARRAR